MKLIHVIHTYNNFFFFISLRLRFISNSPSCFETNKWNSLFRCCYWKIRPLWITAEYQIETHKQCSINNKTKEEKKIGIVLLGVKCENDVFVWLMANRHTCTTFNLFCVSVSSSILIEIFPVINILTMD